MASMYSDVKVNQSWDAAVQENSFHSFCYSQNGFVEEKEKKQPTTNSFLQVGAKSYLFSSSDLYTGMQKSIGEKMHETALLLSFWVPEWLEISNL